MLVGDCGWLWVVMGDCASIPGKLWVVVGGYG